MNKALMFCMQNKSRKAQAVVELSQQEDAAAIMAASLQLLPNGEEREQIVEALTRLSSIETVRDCLAIHAPNWGGAAGREMARLAMTGDEVAQATILAIAKADDGEGVTLAECLTPA